MQTGGLVASPQAWALVSDRFVGRPVDRGHMRIATGERTAAPRRVDPVIVAPEALPSVRAYIPKVCLARLDAGQADWLAELRTTTVVFAAVRGVGSATPDAVELLQRVTLTAQRALTRYDGWLKEITMDDKGTALVAAFGVPPFTHEDDAARAVQAAVTIAADLRALGLATGIGIASGPAFCGPVGNASRRDFAMLGQHVNLAARLMQAAGDDGVLTDARTYEVARGGQTFERLPAHVLKGLTAPIDVYRVRTGERTTGRSAADHRPHRRAGHRVGRDRGAQDAASAAWSSSRVSPASGNRAWSTNGCAGAGPPGSARWSAPPRRSRVRRRITRGGSSSSGCSASNR